MSKRRLPRLLPARASRADSASLATHGWKAIATSAKHRHRVRMAVEVVLGARSGGTSLPWSTSSRWRVPRHVIHQSQLNPGTPELLLRRCLVGEGTHPCSACNSGWLHLRQPQGSKTGIRALAAVSRHLGLTGSQQFSCGSCRGHSNV